MWVAVTQFLAAGYIKFLAIMRSIAFYCALLVCAAQEETSVECIITWNGNVPQSVAFHVKSEAVTRISWVLFLPAQGGSRELGMATPFGKGSIIPLPPFQI